MRLGMGDRRERKLSAVFYVKKIFLLVNPHNCVLFLNVPNLRFTMYFHL